MEGEIRMRDERAGIRTSESELFRWEEKGWKLYLDNYPSNPILIENARANAVHEGGCYMPDFYYDPATGEKMLNYNLIHGDSEHSTNR